MNDNTVISAEAGIQASVFLSEAKDLDLGQRKLCDYQKDERNTCGHNS